jgi:SpoVK/Ycf46/Vps4 family AAA+-type ATPase
MRKGRFDEIFFIDLPALDERRQIFTVHLTRRHRAPAAFEEDIKATQPQSVTRAEDVESLREWARGRAGLAS